MNKRIPVPILRKFKYYDYAKILSYNGVYNILIGNRGKGKSFGAKRKVINDAIKKGDQFVYLRRYKTELATSRATFFADIEYLYPEWDFRINGANAQMSPVLADDLEPDKKKKVKREWITIGFFIALSNSQNQKSVNFPNVKTIIFDEFVIEKGAISYLPQEDVVFNNFYSTVDRYKDKTRVFFLANSVSVTNPYFIAWKIRPNGGDEFIIKDKGFIVCHIDDNQDFNNEVYKTRFGGFIQGTEYATYAVENEFSDNHDAMVLSKDPKARYQFTLETKEGKFSVWYNFAKNYYYIDEKDIKTPDIYTLEISKMTNDKLLVSFSDRPLANLRTAYRKGRVSFDSAVTRNVFTQVFKR